MENLTSSIDDQDEIRITIHSGFMQKNRHIIYVKIGRILVAKIKFNIKKKKKWLLLQFFSRKSIYAIKGKLSYEETYEDALEKAKKDAKELCKIIADS